MHVRYRVVIRPVPQHACVYARLQTTPLVISCFLRDVQARTCWRATPTARWPTRSIRISHQNHASPLPGDGPQHRGGVSLQADALVDALRVMPRLAQP